MKKTIILSTVLLVAWVGQGMAGKGGASGRYVEKHLLPTGEVIVIAEGDFEPRSIGSYSIRLYAKAQTKYPTDAFVCGLVQARDGTVEDVMFADLDGDGIKEIVVTIRSVGTGSYLSGHAYTFREKSLVKVAEASGLPKDADCISVLTGMMP